MRNLTSALIFMIFASLISMVTQAADVSPDPFVNKPRDESDADKSKTRPSKSNGPLDNVEVTQPEPEIERKDLYFYKYDSSVSIGAGFYLTFPSDPPVNIYSLIDLTYDWPNTTAFHIESGLDSVSVGEGHLWTVARWTRRFTERLRPFYSVGPGVRVIPQNGLATFLDISHYFVRGAYGAEYSIGNGPSSIRAEIFLASDLTFAMFYGFTVGYSLGL